MALYVIKYFTTGKSRKLESKRIVIKFFHRDSRALAPVLSIIDITAQKKLSPLIEGFYFLLNSKYKCIKRVFGESHGGS